MNVLQRAAGNWNSVHTSNTRQEKKCISNLKPIICPVRIPPVRKMELPMAMPPLRCFGATSPRYRGCTQSPIPASKWNNIFLLTDLALKRVTEPKQVGNRT